MKAARFRGDQRGRRAGGRAGPPDAQSERLVGLHSVREALRARRRTLHRLWIQRGPERAELRALRAAAERAGVPVGELDPDELAARIDPEIRRSNPQRVILEAGPLPLVSLESLASDRGARRLIVALDGVEDPQNVGSIARVAEGAGARGLVLADRHAPPLGPAVSRASSGAIEWLPVARVPNLGRALDSLREQGLWVVGTDPEASESLYGISSKALEGDLVIVLGAEGRGLRPGVKKRVDHPISIPMYGHVGSLNVATAAAVVLYELIRRSRAGRQ